MDTFKSKFEFIIRRLFDLLPPSIAFDCADDLISELEDFAYIEPSERNYFLSLAKAYFEILGG